MSTKLYVPLWILPMDLEDVSLDEFPERNPVLEAATDAALRGADALLLHDRTDAGHHDAAIHILTLPIYEGLARDEIDRICDIILQK